MSSVIESVESDIVTALKGISYLANSARGVSDIKTFLNLQTVAPPAAIVVFDGERAGKEEVIGASLQQTEFRWTIYLLSRSFGSQGEGRLYSSSAQPGAYQMLDDVIAALEGLTISTPSGSSKLFYVGSARFDVMQTAAVYDSRWRHQFVRQGA